MGINYNQAEGFAEEFAREQENSSDPEFAEVCRKADEEERKWYASLTEEQQQKINESLVLLDSNKITIEQHHKLVAEIGGEQIR